MSEVQTGHKDREERPVIRGDLAPLASGGPWEQMEAQVPKDQLVLLVRKVQAAILGPVAHQDLREAQVNLGSKDNWEMLVLGDLKEKLDLKGNRVRLVPRE